MDSDRSNSPLIDLPQTKGGMKFLVLNDNTLKEIESVKLLGLSLQF